MLSIRFALPLVLSLAACAGYRTVPDAALAYVPSESIPGINAEQEEVYRNQTAFAAAERQLASLQEQAQLAHRAVREAEVSVEKGTQARAVAVRVGDAERARVLAEDLEDVRKRRSSGQDSGSSSSLGQRPQPSVARTRR